ncbi:MAG: hypothetical protein A2289_22975 [Deltaproteobacteria bacterium RIFOXYA12_FULL_58_15]|nr:MAG: hypothetical protein A2289_22975 [Deltaproteobacteria bacterium RIFOXYA12_FULL_58_15]OGR08872.1 MAG: hypothetical protein A2341_27710 [Deltaproteobacteria bacterium RIFOXYB12_FULL_58_9]
MHAKLRAILEEKGYQVHSVAPTATVVEAVDLMNNAGVGALLVKDGEAVVGIVSERDILRRVIGARRDPQTVLISDVMTREVATVKPDLDLEEAMGVVTERRVRHLPVMVDGKVVGMVSSGDLTRWAVHDREFHIQQLVAYITGNYPT